MISWPSLSVRGAGYSLRRRLLVWLLGATALMGVLALLDTWVEARQTAQSVSDRVLAGSAMAIAERVTIGLTGGLQVDIPFSALEMLASTAQDRVFYRVDSAGDGFLTGYDTLTPVKTDADGMTFADGYHDDTPVRIASLARQVSTGEGMLGFTVTVAESTRARDALARAILLRSALRLGAMILGAATVALVLVTLALRPLDRLGQEIAGRAPGDLRPIRAEAPHEVQGLVAAINSFMLRLETAITALRNFTGNASHQIRTPLAVIRTQLALAQRAAGAHVAHDALDKADQAVARAERVLAQLLVLARVDAAAGAGHATRLDAAALSRDLVAEMVPAALRSGIDLGYEGADVAEVAADAVLLAELLRNLLDNALAYAGGEAQVTLRVRAAEGDTTPVVIEVEDNGPGLPPERRAALAAGRRGMVMATGDSMAEGGTGGYGLGLSIVQEIATLFEARLELDQQPAGRGLLVRLTFPPVAAAPAAPAPAPPLPPVPAQAS